MEGSIPPPATNYMTQSKTFCIAPFVGLQVNANGTLLPCCEFDHQASGFGEIPTFRDYDRWQSVDMSRLRQDLINVGLEKTLTLIKKSKLLIVNE